MPVTPYAPMASTGRVARAAMIALALAVVPPTRAHAQPAADEVRIGTEIPAARAAFLDERLARLDTWLDSLSRARRIPGAVVMLVKDGRVAHHRAFGVRDLDTGEPLRPDDLFRIASQTKAVTALAAMMLWEEGRFQLDDPIARWLPSFAKAQVLERFEPSDSSYTARATRRRITVRQLLTHTSGLDYADIGSDAMKAIYAKAGITAIGRPGDVLAERIDVLGTLPLVAEPGERFVYSLSYDVLGRLVEIWSGMPLDEFFRTRIFQPLRMTDTDFTVPAAKRARFVALHQSERGVLRAMRATDGGLADPDQWARAVTYFAGGAGLVSTTADYARFLQLFLNGGELDGVRLLGRKTVELMLTNQMGDRSPAFGLGFGLETAANDARSIVSAGTFSWGGAFNTTYWADPAEGLVALVYTNTYGDAPGLGDLFRTFTYAALR